MEKNQIETIIKSIEGNIKKCEVLRHLLESKNSGIDIDFSWYLSRGYSENQVKVGEELVDLYLKLKVHINSFLS